MARVVFRDARIYLIQWLTKIRHTLNQRQSFNTDKEHLRKIVRGMFWLMLLIISAKVAHSLWRYFSFSAEYTAVSPSANKPPRADAKTFDKNDVQLISQQNWFGKYQPVATPVKQPEPVPVAETRLNVVLRGIAFGARPGAVIEEGGKQQVYLQGETLGSHNAVIEEINRDHVMLRYQGKIERLSLAEEERSTVAVTNKKAVSDEAKQAVAEPAASAPVEIPTAVRQALAKDPQKIFNYIQLTPVRKEGIVGYAVKPGADRSLFDASGFKEGDIAIALNQQDFTDPRAMIALMRQLLEEELNQDIDELHFAPLKIDQQLATVAVIHQQHMRNIAQWLQENGITRATVAPDWMSIPCGFMAGDAQRVICRIDECRGWSAGRALAPVMFRAQLNEQDLPLSLTVVGIAPEKLSAWAGADAERLTVTALPAITTYGEPEGNLLTGPWQPRVSYRKQWARWRVMILPILLILVALAVERGVTLWSVSEQVAQSRTQAEEQFLTLFPEQKRIVNLRSQVTMALKKYRPQADDTRLLAELSAIASTLKSASLSDIEMRGFTFDQKRQILHLQLRAANFASFDKLRSALATDYVVQQDALQKEGDAVSGGVTLRRK
ncbi:TPA: type II secretion system protein GspL [Escherichia coli]|nr:type II secretion system protein GspL [Escherichia coli]HAN8560333.1 type II secretion system protein GspL [Escherichia coli]